jgi:hypothetical protein
MIQALQLISGGVKPVLWTSTSTFSEVIVLRYLYLAESERTQHLVTIQTTIKFVGVQY